MKSTKHIVLNALAVSGLIALPACSGTNDGAETETEVQTDGTGTLAAALGTVPDLSTVSGALVTTNLNSVFDGVGSYTLLAPTNEAFEALGAQGETLMSEEQRPILVGVLRDHILPGYMQPEDIVKAIDTKGGSVSMTTLGGSEVSFTREGETITVTRDDGSSATVAGTAVAAANGVVIPIGGVLTPQ